MYTYKAKLINVVDADTLDAFIDLGFQLTIRQRIRLYQTKPIPEKRDESVEFLKERLASPFIVKSIFKLLRSLCLLLLFDANIIFILSLLVYIFLPVCSHHMI